MGNIAEMRPVKDVTDALEKAVNPIFIPAQSDPAIENKAVAKKSRWGKK
jgi:hypothetical protein